MEQLEETLRDESSSQLSSPVGTNVSGSAIPSNVLLFDDNFVSPFFSHKDPFRYRQLRDAFLNVSTSLEVFKIIGSESDFKRVVDVYFDTIHRWLPILNRRKFMEGVNDLWSDHKADMALLALCVYLVTQIPDENSSSDSMCTSLYVKIKSMYAVLQASGIMNIATVQSGILISLYEVGHGLQPTAYVSMGVHARTAVSLGIQHESLPAPEPTDLRSWRAIEEERRGRWAIVSLDRYISLQNQGRIFAGIDPKLDNHLPVDDAAWDADV